MTDQNPSSSPAGANQLSKRTTRTVLLFVVGLAVGAVLAYPDYKRYRDCKRATDHYLALGYYAALLQRKDLIASLPAAHADMESKCRE